MTLSKKRIGIVFAALTTIFCSSFALYYFKFYKNQSDGPKVEKSITEILAERSAQARKKVESPLGQLIITKNWTQFDQTYQPSTQYQELAETIRGAFIQNSFTSFTPADFDELLLRVIHTFKNTDSKIYPKLGLLTSQFNRLPAPTKSSEAFRILKAWLKSDQPFLKKLAVFKLVASDADPDETAIKVYLHGFTGDTLGVTKVEWFRFTDEIRNVKVKQTCIAELSRLYPKLDSKLRPFVLPILARTPNVESSSLTKYTLHALAQNDVAHIEAALKSIPSLFYNKNLTPDQKEKILKRLDQIPESSNTPFIHTKSREVRHILSSKS